MESNLENILELQEKKSRKAHTHQKTTAPLFEYDDVLNCPFVGFLFDNSIEDHVMPIKPHWHYFTEIIYVLEGNSIMKSDKDSYMVSEGDFIFFHPKSVHSMAACDNKPIRYIVIKLGLDRIDNTDNYIQKLSTIFQTAKNDALAPIYFPKGTLSAYPIREILEHCVYELTQKNYGYNTVVQSQLHTLFIYILRTWREKGFDTDRFFQPDEDNTSIFKIAEYIDAHAFEPLSVENLAKQCNMSYSHFAKSFREMFGRSCKEYIEYQRICKVESFLLFTDFDLSYISAETGFSDCSHLIKTFKKLRGITPKQYRLQHAHNNG